MIQQVLHDLACFCLGACQFVEPDRLRHDIHDLHTRVQGRIRILKDHLQLAVNKSFFRRLSFACNALTKQLDCTAVLPQQTSDHAGNRRLTRATFTHDTESFAFLDGKIYVLNGLQHPTILFQERAL